MERLEERLAPATFSVAAGDVTTLIADINTANANGQANTITLTPGVFDLTQPQNTTFGPTGLPAISSALIINGSGSTIQRDPLAPAFRLFSVLNTGSLTLNGLVLENGLAHGGKGGDGFDEAGGGAGLGGAVFNAGSLTLLDSTLTGNLAIGGQVGYRSSTYGGDGGGGGLGGNGGNGAAPLGGGGYGGGGGGGNQGSGNNGSGVNGGTGGALTGGSGGDQSQAGANATGIGGGGGGSSGPNPIYAGGAGSFGGGAGGGRTAATGNAGFGGGAARFSLPGFGGGGDPAYGAGGGGAGMGGAVFNFGGSVTITNSTLTGNWAEGGCGVSGAGGLQVFVGGSGFGGAVFNLNGSVTLLNATLVSNTVLTGVTKPGLAAPQADGGAIYNLAFTATQGVPNSNPATVTLINSILSGSVGGNDLVNNQAAGAGAATVTASSPNIVTSRTTLGGAVTNGGGILAVSAGLDPVLKNNGGPTPTLALLPGSPAIDAGSNAAVAGLTVDQRGFQRFVNNLVDLGAYEFQPPATVTTLTTTSQGVTATVTAVAPNSNPVQGTVTFFAGSTMLATVPLVNGSAAFSGGGVTLAVYNGFTLGDFIFSPSQATLSLISNGIIAVGADAGALPEVRVYDAQSHVLKFDFFAFPLSFRGGVRVAVGDANGDGVPDIVVGAGPGGGPQVRVFDGRTGQPLTGPLGSFYGLAPSSFTGGVFVAVGDINGDGKADIIVGADAGGGPQVNVFSGKDGSLLDSFNAFPASFTGGVRVGAGDVNGDGKADIVAGAGPGGGPQVSVFSGATGAQLTSFFAFPITFTAGVYVAAGDLSGSGRALILVGAGPGAGPQVNIYDGSGTPLAFFFATDPRVTDVLTEDAIAHAGVRVGVVPAGAQSLILTAPGPGAAPLVAVDGVAAKALLDSFFAFDPTFRGGVFVGG